MLRGNAVRGAALTALVLALDQGSKALVESRLARGETRDVLPFLELRNTRNSGVAFGLGGDVSVPLIALSLAVLAGIIAIVAVNGARPGIWIPAGLLIGGALGNMIDRIDQGSVTDFIKLPSWPTFNVADMAIVFGVAALLWVTREAPTAEDPDL